MDYEVLQTQAKRCMSSETVESCAGDDLSEIAPRLRVNAFGMTHGPYR
jgi:hypothetical protein